MSEYRKYQRTQVAEIAEWTPDFDMTDVSISEADRKAGSPKAGDGIARNPDNHEDRWLIAADYRAKNFAPMTVSDPDIDKIVEQAIRNCTKVGDAASRPAMMDSRSIARRAAELAREQAAKVLDDKREAVPKPRSYELAHYCMGLEDGAAAIRAGKEVG